MQKKNNPEQEAEPTAEELETEEQAQENETGETDEDTQEQDGAAEDEEETEEQEETPDQEEKTDNPQREDPAAGTAEDENAALRSELLQANSRLAAYTAGVAPGMIDDAVTLAMAEAAKSGEVTVAAVTKAMEAVLKRHPEWKADGGNKQAGGFRLGADRDSGTGGRKTAPNTQNMKRWNRFK